MQPGRMLTHYRLGEKIGQGGMGAVYRAHDTVLGREVALKVLPPEFAADGDRLARFQREAKVLASLHHPNIASIFGFETTPECTFLVMELVEGEDLAEVLRRGALPVDEAVAVARQIAEGLEEAHEKGIVHRDLKPANVKRTPDGKVKVLDFGLARALAGQAAGEGHVSSAPTLTAAVTQAGMVLGTAAYMSPEQARGKEVDRRTDIWAFGVLLFEMLTGRQLFAGETVSDTLAGILKTEPDWSTLPAGLPLQVERVLRRCLTKDPRQRLRDIGEARVRLEDPAAESGVFTGAVAAVADTGVRWQRLVPWVLLAASLAAVAWLAVSRSDGGDARPYLHLASPAPKDVAFHVGGSFPGLPVISPDGRRLVFAGRSAEDNRVLLYVRALDADRAVALAGTEDAQYPFWSPDGQWIAFFDRNAGLKKIPAGGGPTQTICAAGNGKGGSWNEADEIIFTPDYNTALHAVPAVGGTPRPVTDLEADEGFDSHRHPQFLPGGRRFLYLARAAGGKDSQVRLAGLDGGDARVVMSASIMARYASGHLLFLNQQTLMAQPFDPRAGTLSGVPVPVAEDVMVLPGAATAAYSASREGVLAYLRGKSVEEATLGWIDRKGNAVETVGDLASYDTVVLSPDGRLAVVTIVERQAGTSDLWIVEIARNFRTRLTNHPADDLYPLWSPDGRFVYFASDRDGHYAIYRREVGGAAAEELVYALPTAVLPWDLTADGRTLVYSTEGEGTRLDLWCVELAEGSEPRLLKRSPSPDGAARLSPDNRWLAFWSEESGAGQVYVAPWPAMSPVSQVSTTTGTWSFWSADGRELIYQEEAGRLLSAALTPGPRGMEVGVPATLFDHITVKFEGPWLSPTADGQRFLSIAAAESDPPAHCDVVLGWASRLRP